MSYTFEEILEQEGVLVYTNVGVSMLPLIHEGKDVMTIRAISGEIKKYDAVLFCRPNINGRGRYVLHRVLKVYPNGTYFIVGDNTLSGEIVKRENILGVLTEISRKGKKKTFDGFGFKLYLLFWIKPYKFRFFVLRIKNFIRSVLYFFYKHTLRKLIKRKK